MLFTPFEWHRTNENSSQVSLFDGSIPRMNGWFWFEKEWRWCQLDQWQKGEYCRPGFETKLPRINASDCFTSWSTDDRSTNENRRWTSRSSLWQLCANNDNRWSSFFIIDLIFHRITLLMCSCSLLFVSCWSGKNKNKSDVLRCVSLLLRFSWLFFLLIIYTRSLWISPCVCLHIVWII